MLTFSKISFLPRAKWGLQFKTPLPLMAFSLIIGFINKSRNLELIFSRFLEIFDFFRSPRNLHRNYQIFKNRLQIPGFRSEILAMKCGTELKAPLSEIIQIPPYFATFYKLSKMREGSASQRLKRSLGNVGKSRFSKKSLSARKISKPGASRAVSHHSKSTTKPKKFRTFQKNFEVPKYTRKSPINRFCLYI